MFGGHYGIGWRGMMLKENVSVSSKKVVTGGRMGGGTGVTRVIISSSASKVPI